MDELAEATDKATAVAAALWADMRVAGLQLQNNAGQAVSTDS